MATVVPIPDDQLSLFGERRTVGYAKGDLAVPHEVERVARGGAR